MITDSFDIQSPAIINPRGNENVPKVEAVIFTFSHVIEQYVVKNYACEKIGEIMMGHGATSVYCIEYHGKRYGFFRTWVGAPACVGTIEEIQMVLNTDKFIHFGAAGCLEKRSREARSWFRQKHTGTKELPIIMLLPQIISESETQTSWRRV